MYKQILLPLDGSDVSESALTPARNVAQAFGARLHLLQVLSSTDQFALTRGMDYGALNSGYSQNLIDEVIAAQSAGVEEYLDGVAAGLRADGVDVVTATADGTAADRIIEYAEAEGIDLIVMSTHGRGGVRRFLVGSVTDRVIRSTNLPVLVAHPG